MGQAMTSEPDGGGAGNGVSTWGGKRPGAGRKRGAWSGKPFRDALARAAMRRDTTTGRRRIEKLAERLVANALAGDTVALKEIADRLDGRVSGHTDATVAVSFVVRMPEALDAEAWARTVRPNGQAAAGLCHGGDANALPGPTDQLDDTPQKG
jgi:hypothetical protein